MFYLNRTGAPEGPYEEGRIVAMIGSGELVYGNICWVGHNQWAPLNAHPPFARAIADREAASRASGHAAAGPAHGYAAPAPAYGAGSSASGSGVYGSSASAGYGSPAPSPSEPRNAQRAAKGSGRLILILAVIGIAGLFLVGTAIGAYMLFFGASAPKVSAAVPRDTELFVELESLKKFVGDLKDVQFIEASSSDDEKVIQDAVSAVSRSFDISETDATNLLLAAGSAGVAARKLATNPEGVLVLGFQRSGPVDTLLESRRFSAAGAFGAGGKKYLLARKVVAEKQGSDLTFRALSELESTGRREILVWFAEQRLLVIGSEPLVLDASRVIESGAPPLADNPNFESAAKEYPADARLVGFIDPGVAASITDRSMREFVDAYFKPAGPITASMRVKSAGFVVSLAGRFIGAKLPKSSAHEPAIKLTLADRLAAETFAYAAFSTKSRMSGSEVEKVLLDQVGAAEPAARAEIERGLRQLEQLLGVTMQKVYDSLGEQAALALMGPGDFAIEQARNPEVLARFAMTYVQQLKDDAALKTVARELKSRVLSSVREVNVTDDGSGGFVLTPRDMPLAVSLRARFLDRHLFVSAGANGLNERAEAAFLRAERTLKEDAAHTSARAVLPDVAHFLVWVDSGRSADTILKSPIARVMIDASGIQTSQFKLTGSQRVTTALSARAEVQNETWTYRVDTLNLQALAPMAGAAALLGGASGSLLPAPPRAQ